MTHEERLQKIKNSHEERVKANEFYTLGFIHADWLIEQAELAQELEESCNIGNCLSKFTNKTETDNKRYQEALEKIKDNSSCVVAFGYAVKALEESK